MKFIRIKRYDIAMTKKNPDKVFIFGDNLAGYGKGGQAQIRGQPNAYGIPTKKKPTMQSDAYMTDIEYSSNIKAIDAAIAKIPKNKDIVFPKDNIGTGRALMKQNAPRTYKYLQESIMKLEKNYG
jgi:hypothetical protein